MADKAWKQAIIEVLVDAGEPMTRTEIADAIVSRGLRVRVGATPAHTVAAQVSTSIGQEGVDSPFIRVGRGEYALKSIVQKQSLATPEALVSADAESEAGGIQAFGVYWLREMVHWVRNPKLLGQQQLGSEAVDMSDQIGIYLLYDEREVIYVGRSIDRPVGQRLYEHTQDRLRARWNRFSWYGLYRVTDAAKLTKAVIDINAALLIRALEAVLIESMEPRQNRKRGDDFSGIEYIQKIDPQIDRERKVAILKELEGSIRSAN
jgi:predicted GIY-YIG superfamily endonuclease